MNGTNFVHQLPLSRGPALNTGWSVAGTGKINADIKSDILWQNSNGQNSAWLMSDTNYLSSVMLKTRTPAFGWKIAALLDMNYDANLDLIWQHADGRVETWLMNGSNFVKSVSLRKSTLGWNIIGPKEF
jgi:hypothetical protein